MRKSAPSLRRRLPAAAVIAAQAALCSCRGSGEAKQPPPDPPAVEAVVARSGTVPLTERVTGTVRARNQVEIRSEISAPISAVFVRSGDAVRKGQALVQLEDGALRDQLRQAEASVALAEAAAREQEARLAEVAAQAERTRALAEEKLVSAMERESLEAQLAGARASADRARAAIEQARATAQERRSLLGKALIRAPVSGRIGQRQAEVGMLARPDDLLFLLGNLQDLVVEIPLTQEILRAAGNGTPVHLSGEALGPASVQARISRVSPFLQPGSLSTIAEIDLDNTSRRLSPGMFVTVDVEYSRSPPATLVPRSAIWEDLESEEFGVFVVSGMPKGAEAAAPASAGGEVPREARPVALRRVEVVARGRDAVGLRGVEPGEWVVVVGQHLLARDGSPAARVRPANWERVLELQSRQREDLLEAYLSRQREMAAEGVVAPPPSEEFLKGGAGTGAPRP